MSRVRRSSKIIYPKLDCFLKIDKERDHPVTYIIFTLREEVTEWSVSSLKEYTP